MVDQYFYTLAARKLCGEAMEEDLEELEKFFAVDEKYRKEFHLLKTFWEHKSNIQSNTEDALQKVMQQMEAGSDQSNATPFEKPSINRDGPIRLLFSFSKAAVFIVAISVAVYFILRKSSPAPIAKVVTNEIHWQSMETPKGTKTTIVLADGTKVTMNADSKLRFPKSFSGMTREVYLTGEAFFSVTHNEKSPFIIHTSKMNIKVLGTEFNVRSYPEDSTSETTLIRGLIEVTLKDRPSDKIILRPKEKLIVSNETLEKDLSSITASSTSKDAQLVVSNLHYISPTDSAVVETSWMDDKLVFQDVSFGNLAMDMERWYGFEIEFTNNMVKDYRFTGIFEKETIDQALKALRLTEKFNYNIEGNKITIY